MTTHPLQQTKLSCKVLLWNGGLCDAIQWPNSILCEVGVTRLSPGRYGHWDSECPRSRDGCSPYVNEVWTMLSYIYFLWDIEYPLYVYFYIFIIILIIWQVKQNYQGLKWEQKRSCCRVGNSLTTTELAEKLSSSSVCPPSTHDLTTPVSL